MNSTLTPTSITFQGKKKDVMQLLSRLSKVYGDMSLKDYLAMVNKEKNLSKETFTKEDQCKVCGCKDEDFTDEVFEE